MLYNIYRKYNINNFCDWLAFFVLGFLHDHCILNAQTFTLCIIQAAYKQNFQKEKDAVETVNYLIFNRNYFCVVSTYQCL